MFPYIMDYIGLCGPKGYGFSAVLVIKKGIDSTILLLNRVWLFTLVLNWISFVEEATFSSSLHQ